MLARGRRHVVSLGSLAGKKGTPYNAVYSATKAGLIEWTHAMRIEFGETPVSFSVICPGYVTQVGMFARLGIDAPRSLGSCTPDQVADAVVQALRHDRAEILVNSMPVRPLLALNALWPGLGDRWMTRLGSRPSNSGRSPAGQRRVPPARSRTGRRPRGRVRPRRVG